MAKDPAFLFYPNDYMGGTMGMTFEEKGAYMDLLVLQFNKGAFTIDQAKKILNGSFERLWPVLIEKFVEESGRFLNERLDIEKRKRAAYTESRRQSRQKSNEDEVKIYLIKDLDSGYIKIGSSVNPYRRFSEMCNQKNPAITVGERNYELVWFSECTVRSNEKKLHDMFKTKVVTGEWFLLSDNDILLITSTYEGTYVNRTLERTENENENRNEIKNKDLGKSENLLKISLPENILEAAEMNQFTFTKNRNTDFVKSQWKIFIKERTNDPPERIKQHLNNKPELYQYFLNWNRNKFPSKNGTHKQNNTGKPVATIVHKGGFGSL